LADRNRGRRLDERARGVVLADPAQLAALRRGAAVDRLLLGELDKVGPRLQLADDLLGRTLGVGQDVPGLDLADALALVIDAVVALLQRLLGRLRLDQPADQRL